jgi:hypothetical protein
MFIHHHPDQEINMRELLHEVWASFTPWFRSFGNIGHSVESYTEWGRGEADCFNQVGKVEQAAKLAAIKASVAA